MIRYEDDCVNCEVCRNCGAKKRTPRIYCDECGVRLYSDDTVYMLPGKPHLCADCLLAIVPHMDGEKVLPDETMDV